MPGRTTVKIVTFPHPFTLRGMDEERPAGTDVEETDKEIIEPLSFAAYAANRDLDPPAAVPGRGQIGTGGLDRPGRTGRSDEPGHHDPPNTRSNTMTMQPPLTPPPPTSWTIMKGYFVPPLAIPVVLLLAVALFALIHGPVI